MDPSSIEELPFIADIDTERSRLQQVLLQVTDAGASLEKRKARIRDALQELDARRRWLDDARSRPMVAETDALITAEYLQLDSILDTLTPLIFAIQSDSADVDMDTNRFINEVERLALSRHHLNTVSHQATLHRTEKNSLAEFVANVMAKSASPLGVSLQAGSIPVGPLLSETITEFVRAKRVQDKWTEKTEKEYKAVFELFVRLIGDIPLAEIDDSVVIKYLETLKKLPANMNKSPVYVGKHIEEILSMNPIPMAVRTVNKNIERVSSLFKWAIGKKRYAITYNPATGMSLDESGTKKRLPFTNPELIALFSGKEYTARKFENPYAYWLMPMGLLTGARLGELCQLYLVDFVDHNGVACIDISDEEAGQRVKNENARRLVPIHSLLIELGLLDYVKLLRDRGEERLFPELNERRDGFAQAASNWFQRYKKKCGILDRYTKVFHSFRHTFISALLNDEVPEIAVGQIVGHEADLITGKIYWNVKDAAKRKPTVEKFTLTREVLLLIPQFTEVTILQRRPSKHVKVSAK